MATAEKILRLAREQIGVREEPAGSNQVVYNTWYYGKKVSGDAYPWCAAFVQWVFDRAGAELPVKTASCGELMRAAEKAGQWAAGGFRPGDVVLYDFGHDGAPDHCGIVEAIDKDSVTAIEGNTSVSGSQSNGGTVCRKKRPLKQILGAVRPRFDREDLDNTPSPAHRDGVAWAVEAGILRGNSDGDLMLHQALTREQMCTMLFRYDYFRTER